MDLHELSTQYNIDEILKKKNWNFFSNFSWCKGSLPPLNFVKIDNTDLTLKSNFWGQNIKLPQIQNLGGACFLWGWFWGRKFDGTPTFNYTTQHKHNLYASSPGWDWLSSYKKFSRAFSTKFRLFLGGSIQWNTTKNFSKNSFNPSLVITHDIKFPKWINYPDVYF